MSFSRPFRPRPGATWGGFRDAQTITEGVLRPSVPIACFLFRTYGRPPERQNVAGWGYIRDLRGCILLLRMANKTFWGVFWGGE